MSIFHRWLFIIAAYAYVNILKENIIQSSIFNTLSTTHPSTKVHAEGSAAEIFLEVDKIFAEENISPSPDCLRKAKVIFVVGEENIVFCQS